MITSILDAIATNSAIVDEDIWFEGEVDSVRIEDGQIWRSHHRIRIDILIMYLLLDQLIFNRYIFDSWFYVTIFGLFQRARL